MSKKCVVKAARGLIDSVGACELQMPHSPIWVFPHVKMPRNPSRSSLSRSDRLTASIIYANDVCRQLPGIIYSDSMMRRRGVELDRDPCSEPNHCQAGRIIKAELGHDLENGEICSSLAV